MSSPLNTGLQIITAIQAAGTNARLGAMAREEERRRATEQAVLELKQNIFALRRSLEEASQNLEIAPQDSLYVAEMVTVLVHSLDDAFLNDLRDKEYLHQLKVTAIQMRDFAYGKIDETQAIKIRRLAYLKVLLPQLETLRDWVLIDETMKASAILFFPARLGFVHFIFWFLSAVILTQLLRAIIGVDFTLLCLPTPFFLGYLRKTVVQKCNQIASRTGGSLGKHSTISQASKIRNNYELGLKNIGHTPAVNTAKGVKAEISEINQEINSIHDSMSGGVILRSAEGASS